MDVVLLLLRVLVGAIFMAHGAQKLFGAFGGPGLKGLGRGFEQMGLRPGYTMALLAGLGEFVGGILVLVGFLTPLGALAIILTMIMAVAKVHLPNGFFNDNGGYEYNLVLAVLALILIFTGAGLYSLDAAIF